MTDRLRDQCEIVLQSLWFEYRHYSKKAKLNLERYKKYDRCSVTKQIKILKRVFDELCAILQLKRRFIQFNIALYDFGFLKAGGTFEENSCIGCNITIYYVNNFTLIQYVGVMLHELGHFFHQTYHILDLQKVEELTDIMLVYMGFGDILKQAYQPYTSNSVMCTLGYIDFKEIEECQAFFQYGENAI